MISISMLRQLDPAAQVRPEEQRERVLAQALAGIAADAAVPQAQRVIGHRARRRRSRRPRPAIRVGAVAALAAAAVCTLLVVQTASPSGRTPLSTAAAEVLEQAAVAAAQAGPAIGDAPYVHVRKNMLNATDTLYTTQPLSYLQEETFEEWFSSDGSGPGLIRRTYGKAIYANPEQEQAHAAAGMAPVPTGTVTESATPAGEFPGDFQPEALAHLPRDPDQLYDRLRSRAGNDPARTLTLVRDLLTPATAHPQLVSALFGAAARIPGVERLPDTIDAEGRPAAAVCINHHGAQHVLLFDPQQGLFLGESVTITARDAYWPAGTVVHRTAVTIQGVNAPGA